MKFNLSVALLASAVISQGTADEKKDVPCTNSFECLFKNLNSNPEFTKKAKECANEQDAFKKQQCILIAAGLKTEQIQFMLKMIPLSEECEKTPKEKAEKCTANCKGDDAKKCAGKCKQTSEVEEMDCLAKKANLSNFDSKKSVECSNKCDDDELSELFNCNYKCGEVVYKGLGAEMKVSDNKEEKKDGDKKEEKKVDDKKGDDKKGDKPATSNANRIQFGSLNLVACALPLAFLFFN